MEPRARVPLIAALALALGACAIAHHTPDGMSGRPSEGGVDAPVTPGDAMALDRVATDASEVLVPADVPVTEAAMIDAVTMPDVTTLPDTGAPDVPVVVDSGPCPPGELLCGSVCTDVQNSHENCGACGNSCGPATCSSGSCDCSWGQHFCHGGCVYYGTTDNCGSCGDRCSNVCFFGSCI